MDLEYRIKLDCNIEFLSFLINIELYIGDFVKVRRLFYEGYSSIEIEGGLYLGRSVNIEIVV